MNARFVTRALLACALSLARPATLLAQERGSSLQDEVHLELDLHGHVYDKATNTPIPGVSIRAVAVGTPPKSEIVPQTVTGSDGSYHIKIHINYFSSVLAERVGYVSQKLDVSSGAQTADLYLTPEAVPIEGISVTSIMAREGKSASAFTNVTKADIARDYYGQDLPMLLMQTPGAYAYSDAGNGIGYSYLKIRGFASRRIGVTINGIPLNDPESREVYWIDHPDLAASAQEIQVQRGVGASTYGTTAIGGSVNVETVPYSQDRYLTLEAGGGSFGTQRYVAQGSSGLLEGKYALSARLSRILTDGYRDASWSDLWSYFVGIARVDSRLVSRLNLYGGPEETHLAYLGVPREYLDGAITGSADQDRRFNPLTYRNERDHFFEPHYELLNDYKASDKVNVSSSLFYFPGKGFYDEFREDRDLREYGYPDDPSTPASTDIVRRRWVKNVHLGWIPRARYASGQFDAEAGLDLRFHEGRHWGELLWSADQPANPEPNHVYYDYKGDVVNTSGFVRSGYAITPRLRGTLDLALHHQRYELKDDVYSNYFFTEDYTFLTPRVGAIATLKTGVEAYASYSKGEAEPIFRELFDPENAGSLPAFSTILPSGELQDPLVHPEKVDDWALGVRAHASWGEASLGGYWMDFRDEIVYNGSLDDNGNPITGNAARSRHRGIEASVAAHATKALEVRGALQWSNDRFVDYKEYVDSTTTIDYSGNAIAGFPEFSGRLAASYRFGKARVELAGEHAGRQFLDNNEDANASIEPWTVAHAAVGLTLPNFLGKSTEITGRVTNLFDTRYETAGYVDFPAPTYAPTPVWIPAATRAFFVGVKTNL